MEFKRKESFRHTLTHPIDFECVVRHREMEIAVQAHGQIVDISPQGLHISVLQPLPQDGEGCVLSLEFKIFERVLRADGEVVWQRTIGGDEYRYGVQLHPNVPLQEMIVADLKARRREEVFVKKGR